MMLPRLYLSRPATVIPDAAVDNDAVLSRVRESFRGPASEWIRSSKASAYVFDRCNTKMRYLDEDPALSPGEFASRAAAACLQENGVAANDIDLLIYGGIARDAFEPATAAEVAGRLGAKPLHAMDVTCACAGLIEALHVATGYFAIHDEMQTALICAGELTRDRISYDMGSLEDVALGVAGLTLGNAAAAFLVSREPLPPGSARLVGLRHKTLSEHYALCRAPVDGRFTSHSKELFALAVHVPPEIRRLLADAGWSPEDVDHYAFHQPSERAPGASLGRARRAAPGVRAYPLAVREHGEHLMGRRARLPPEERHRRRRRQDRHRQRRGRLHDRERRRGVGVLNGPLPAPLPDNQ